MTITSFEDIVAWQKGKILTLELYRCLGLIKDYSFKDQCCRAAVSVMNNIAEGFERKTDKEFHNFLSIAKGSCGEVRSMLYVARELRYITDQDFEKLHALALEISKILSGFMKSLR